MRWKKRVKINEKVRHSWFLIVVLVFCHDLFATMNARGVTWTTVELPRFHKKGLETCAPIPKPKSIHWICFIRESVVFFVCVNAANCVICR